MAKWVCTCYYEDVEVEVEADTLEEAMEEAAEQADGIAPSVDYCECEEG